MSTVVQRIRRASGALELGVDDVAIFRHIADLPGPLADLLRKCYSAEFIERIAEIDVVFRVDDDRAETIRQLLGETSFASYANARKLGVKADLHGLIEFDHLIGQRVELMIRVGPDAWTSPEAFAARLQGLGLDGGALMHSPVIGAPKNALFAWRLQERAVNGFVWAHTRRTAFQNIWVPPGTQQQVLVGDLIALELEPARRAGGQVADAVIQRSEQLLISAFNESKIDWAQLLRPGVDFEEEIRRFIRSCTFDPARFPTRRSSASLEAFFPK